MIRGNFSGKMLPLRLKTVAVTKQKIPGLYLLNIKMGLDENL